MTEIYVKALIPILLLTMAEVAFFFIIGTKDLEDSISSKISTGLKIFIENLNTIEEGEDACIKETGRTWQGLPPPPPTTATNTQAPKININPDIISMLKILNERTLNCSILNRENSNGRLFLRALFLIFLIISMIIWLFSGIKPTGTWLEWWFTTFLESILLVSMLAYFQILFLNTIIKNPDMMYFTMEEIKYNIYKKLREMKDPTI